MSTQKTPYHVVLMTAANAEEAERIAERLVDGGLAACVNVVAPCRSVYRWQGQTVKEDEVLMIAKTRRARFAAIEKVVTEMHSYNVPEIVAIDMVDASEGYFRFLEELLGAEDG
jgi:periplasmic divalent cation tolerance protein